MHRISTFLAVAFAIAGCEGFKTATSEVNGTTSPFVGNDPCEQQNVYRDADVDTFGDPNVFVSVCKGKVPAGYVVDNTDCNDDPNKGGAAIHPGMIESCDGVDNDCKGGIDDTTTSWHLDHDGDKYGDPNPKFELNGSCKGLGDQKSYVANGDDCNDNDASVNPGAKEVCDHKDNNCNKEVDEGVLITFYADLDADLHGVAAKPVKACEPSKGIAILSDDCNDADATIYLTAPELCDGKDNDCNGSTDENVQKTFFKDDDGDGYGAPDKPVPACSVPTGATTTSNDCNDGDKTIHPGAAEVCDNIDQNCDSVTDEDVKLSFYFDADGDGRAGANQPIFACTAPKGYFSDKLDCDDKDPNVYEGAPEICDGKINDCLAKKLVEPDSLCDDGDKFTKDTCDGIKLCLHDQEKLILSCFNPDDYKVVDGYACSVSYFFGDPATAGQFNMTLGKDSVTLLMKDVCSKLNAGLTLRVNSAVFLDWDNLAAIWVGGYFTKLVDSFTNAAVSGVPGNVTLSTNGLDFNYTKTEFKVCQ